MKFTSLHWILVNISLLLQGTDIAIVCNKFSLNQFFRKTFQKLNDFDYRINEIEVLSTIT